MWFQEIIIQIMVNGNFPNGVSVNKVRRTRKIPKEEERSILNIGVLRDPKDLLADIDLDKISDKKPKNRD